MPEALIARITSRGPGAGSGNSLSSSLRSPRNATPFMVLLRCAVFGVGACLGRVLINHDWVGNRRADVRFTPKSGQIADISACPLCAKSGLVHRSKRPTSCTLHLIPSSAAPARRTAMLSCGFHDRLWGARVYRRIDEGYGGREHSTRPGLMQFLPDKLSLNWPSPSPQGSRNASLDRSDLDACRFQWRGEGWQPKRSPRRRPSGSSSSKTR